jgi:transcriptional regulator with XRE-family HTH domain
MVGRMHRDREAVPDAASLSIAIKYAYRDLAVHVRRLRLQLGFSQRALALRMATSERAIRRIEKQEHNVTVEVLVRLAEALDVGVRALLAPTPKPRSRAEDPDLDGRIARAESRRKRDIR